MSESTSQRLLEWYLRHGRELPWRETDDPYAIWVSEVMLQQTQVTTVIPYYHRFLERFPTVADLAAASLDEMLALWQGLGYYRRARALHKAARIVVNEHGGVLPSDPTALRALPGIGDYTAGAILSIAYQHDVPAIDGNVVRVVARLRDYGEDPTRAAGKHFVRRAAVELLVPGQAGESNQAIMELGATLCKPRNPACDCCPLRQDCLALANSTVTERPIRRERAPTPIVHIGAALVCQDERILLIRRVPEGLLGGLWELPAVEHAQTADGTTLGESVAQKLGASVAVGDELATIQHAYTHFRVVVRVFAAQIDGAPAADGDTWDDLRWLTPDELPEVGITGVTRKILAVAPWPGSDRLL